MSQIPVLMDNKYWNRGHPWNRSSRVSSGQTAVSMHPSDSINPEPSSTNHPTSFPDHMHQQPMGDRQPHGQAADDPNSELFENYSDKLRMLQSMMCADAAKKDNLIKEQSAIIARLTVRCPYLIFSAISNYGIV